ncbi:hypothetical protein [Caenimonas soli]|uniref:hypothetical protein n=1 Tax=Caenimonas soli TaxID=2735555 RepID=UPI001555ACC9|nr:hypothetical protein [Caenimonas soli]NPC58960.1 hypothetical protein [Caenimonas soli]
MKPGKIRCAAVLWVAAAAPVFAEPQTQDCQVQPSQADPFVDRVATLSRYEQLPPYCLKAVFMQCAEQANQQMLDFGSAATCSIAYEALLKRGFSGDFQALIAWWRTQRNESASAN